MMRCNAGINGYFRLMQSGYHFMVMTLPASNDNNGIADIAGGK